MTTWIRLSVVIWSACVVMRPAYVVNRSACVVIRVQGTLQVQGTLHVDEREEQR